MCGRVFVLLFPVVLCVSFYALLPLKVAKYIALEVYIQYNRVRTILQNTCCADCYLYFFGMPGTFFRVLCNTGDVSFLFGGYAILPDGVFLTCNHGLNFEFLHIRSRIRIQSSK